MADKERKGRKYTADPICPIGDTCRYGAEKLIPRRHHVCIILTDTDFGERKCPFWKPREGVGNESRVDRR